MSVTRPKKIKKKQQRQWKLSVLRAKYKAARSEPEKAAVLAKVSRVARWLTAQEFLAPLAPTQAQ